MPQDRLVAPTGAELVCEIFVDEGVTHVFGNPGTTEIPFVSGAARPAGATMCDPGAGSTHTRSTRP